MSDITCCAVLPNSKAAERWFRALHGRSISNSKCGVLFHQPGDDPAVRYATMNAVGYDGHEHALTHLNYATLDPTHGYVNFSLRVGGPEVRYLGQGNPVDGVLLYIQLLRQEVRGARGVFNVDEDQIREARRGIDAHRAASDMQKAALRAWEASARYRGRMAQRQSALRSLEEARRAVTASEAHLTRVSDNTDRQRQVFVRRFLQNQQTGQMGAGQGTAGRHHRSC